MPTHVCNDPIIHPGITVQSMRTPLAKPHPPNSPPVSAVDPKQKSNLLIRYMCVKGTDRMFFIVFINMDKLCHVQKTPEKIILSTDKKIISIWIPVSRNAVTFPPFCISGRPDGQRGLGHAETTHQPPLVQVVSIPLSGM